jgi:hypothetical protein
VGQAVLLLLVTCYLWYLMACVVPYAAAWP